VTNVKVGQLLGGDFNIIRKTNEKNKPCVLPRWSHIFNSIIDVNGLKEIKLIGRQYTWANNLPDPTYEKLDRVLVTSEWDRGNPLVVVTGMTRDISDHVPLILKCGPPPQHCNSFRYENCWVEREGFAEIVTNCWTRGSYHVHDIDKWQEKMRRLRRPLKGWHINYEGEYRRENKGLLEKLDVLDKKGEATPLSTIEKELQVTLLDRLKKLLREEEIKWRQRAKEKDLKEGDGNTKYFHLKASGRWKKNYISVLQNNGEEIYGESDLIKHVTDFYKQLFGPSTISTLNLNGIDCKQLTEEDRQELTKPFDLEEIKRVVFDMKHNKAIGLMGSQLNFIKYFGTQSRRT
jgi:hypothetical protein